MNVTVYKTIAIDIVIKFYINKKVDLKCNGLIEKIIKIPVYEISILFVRLDFMSNYFIYQNLKKDFRISFRSSI